MTGISHSNTNGHPSSGARASFPSLGLAALITGAVMPVWGILATVSGGLEAAAWIPVIVLFLFPFNIVFFALLVMAVVCGIFAIRTPGTGRVLGWVGLILGGVQLIAAVAYLVWAGTDFLFGG